MSSEVFRRAASEILLAHGFREVDSTSRAVGDLVLRCGDIPSVEDVAKAVDPSLAIRSSRSRIDIARILVAQFPRDLLLGTSEPHAEGFDAVVAVALDIEFSAVQNLLSVEGEGLDGSGTWVLRGRTPAGARVAVVKTGQGNVASSATTASFLRQNRVVAAVFTGIAGGLHGLKIGTVVVSNQIHDYEAAEDAGGLASRSKSSPASYRLVQVASAVARRGVQGVEAIEVRPIASGEKLVTNSTSRTAEWMRVVASDAAAVEMEGLGFIIAATRLEVPAIVVRGISDHLDDKDVENDLAKQPVAASAAARVAIAIVDEYVRSLGNE